MLGIQVECLTGRYVATQYNDRSRPEWPPHPARLFSALVATLHDRDPVEQRERAALEWFEQQGAPTIAASQCGVREVVEHFVWPNDPTVSGGVDESMRELERALAAARERIEPSVNAGGADPKELKKELKARERERTKLAARVAAVVAGERTETESGQDVKRALQVLRLDPAGRQPRTFPSVSPFEPVVEFVWPNAEPERHTREDLADLLLRVARLGHSSSLVRCALVDSPRPPTYVPAADGPIALRVVGPGQLGRLEAEYERHRGEEPRILPCRFQTYRLAEVRTALHVATTPFGVDWIVFERVAGPPLLVACAVEVGRALRGALLAHADAPIPEALSGHTADNGKSRSDHCAFIALPYVGHPNATGAILGVAVALPRELSPESRRSIYRALRRWEEDSAARDGGEARLALKLGRAGVLTLQRRTGIEAHPRNLDPEAWSGPAAGARRWATVTPVALDRFPGKLHSRNAATSARACAEAEASIALSCERIGLPRPVRVDVLWISAVSGAPPVRAFPRFSSHPGEPPRARVHARIEFGKPVRGPVILGAGRHFGLGLCRPVGDRD